MITYTSDKKRFENFLESQKKIKNLELFEAIIYNKEVIYDTIIDKKYLKNKNWKSIGCSLSHYLVQKKSFEENVDWTLTIEDDFEIGEEIQINFFEEIIKKAKSIGCNYVHFDCRTRFRKKQYSNDMKEGDFFYRMIPQWGAGCYLAHRSASESFLNCIPIDKPSDMHWFFFNLNKLKNPMVINPKINPFNNLGIDDYLNLKEEYKNKYSSIIKSGKIKHL